MSLEGCGRLFLCAGFASGVTVRFSASTNSTTRNWIIQCAVAIDVQTEGRA
jgi:hypothetical protein